MMKQMSAPSRRWIKPQLVLSVSLLASFLSPGSVAQDAPAPVKITMGTAMPVPDGAISSARDRAYRLFRAITGVNVAIDDARLVKMEALISAGDDRGAAAVATNDPAFYDIRLRDIARKMSVREESITAPLSDFVATFVGVARDGLDARELLTGNFFYRADPAKVTLPDGSLDVRSDALADIVQSNRHYQDLQSKTYSLHSVLVREDGQKIANATNDGVIVMPDAAGLLTTRAWIAAHADAGTNRRLVEFSFRQFMCVPMEAWMDASRPDDFVARDVDRFPGGSNQTYQVTCKACHTQMDAFRPAFAFVDFNGDRIRYTPGQVAGKLNRNSAVFPAGYVTRDSNWINYATAMKNSDQFGWRSALTGTGLGEFGRLLANSRGFSRCMTKRVFTAICKREPSAEETTLIRTIADRFESDYQLKHLAEIVAISPACLST
ncbi:MAG: hypothetical protein NDI61_06080 [Bdellovibrionaceae bacterium]|nr:hypothetical protein [Pseudobdellovibrionaceae bacterium]